MAAVGAKFRPDRSIFPSLRGELPRPNRRRHSMPVHFSEVEMDEAEGDALALAVDERVLEVPEGCDPARLFGVRLRATRADGFVLVPFWSGVAREVPGWLVPPDGCDAIAIESGGWAAPMDGIGADGTFTRPSQHPEAQRMHTTALVYGRGVDVSVLRVGDEPPRVMRGGVGVVPGLVARVLGTTPLACLT